MRSRVALSLAVVGAALRSSRRGLDWSWGFNENNVNLTALEQFEAWDRKNGASARKMPGIDLNDQKSWPEVKASEGWDTGLKDPKVVVVSMPQRAARRNNFKKRFQEVGWKLDAEWMPAVDGAAIPSELRWLKGYVDDKVWDHDKPGNWGCYLSHLALLRKHHARCPTCDLVVFEDDAVFAPSFHKRWQKFLKAVPQDWSMLRLGAQSLWEPSWEATEEYIHASSVSNTWGYVVRADVVDKLATKLADLPEKGDWGVDAVMQLFTVELKTYVPRVPILYAVGACSDSSAKIPGHGCSSDGAEFLKKRVQSLIARWPQGYYHTYCTGPGLRRNQAPNAVISDTACADVKSITCCPYYEPPVAPMTEV